MKSDQNHVDKRVLGGKGGLQYQAGKGLQYDESTSIAFLSGYIPGFLLTGARQVCIKTMKPLILNDGWSKKKEQKKSNLVVLPIGFMYGIYTYIYQYHKNQPNASK